MGPLTQLMTLALPVFRGNLYTHQLRAVTGTVSSPTFQAHPPQGHGAALDPYQHRTPQASG